MSDVFHVLIAEDKNGIRHQYRPPFRFECRQPRSLKEQISLARLIECRPLYAIRVKIKEAA